MCSKMQALRFVLLTIIWSVASSSPVTHETRPFKVYLYTDANHSGTLINVTVTNCTNLEPEFVNSVSSVDTSSHCLHMYDAANCTGNSIQIPPRSPFHHRLDKWNFNDAAKSVGFCQNPKAPRSGTTVSNINGKAIPVVMFTKSFFRGKSIPVAVNGCTKLIDDSYVITKDILSIQIPKGECVLAFVNERNGHNCINDGDILVYEFHEGIPSMNDFTEWGLSSKRGIRAFSPCESEGASPLPVKSKPENQSSAISMVTLFSKSYFGGFSVTIPLNFTGCKDLGHTEWEGVAESLIISKGSCIVAHKQHGCQDTLNTIHITSSIPTLSDHNLDGAIRSISVCNVTSDPTSAMVEDSQWKTLGTTVLFIITVIFAGLFVVGFFHFRRYAKRYQAIAEKLSENEIEEFMQGLGLDLESEDDIRDNNVNDIGHDNYIKQNSRCSSDLLAQNQPFNSELEIPKSQLQLETKCLLGAGQFGVVYKGILHPQSDQSDNIMRSVAVKTSKAHGNVQDLRMLLKEVKIMMYVGKHNNVAEFLGCCTNNLRQGEILIVMAYYEKGSLECYLKANRSNYVNRVKKGIYSEESSVEISPNLVKNPNYVSVMPMLNQEINGSSNPNLSHRVQPLDIQRLLTWCIEIAEGMAYLAYRRRVIHGDLSTRNILLGGDLTARISDFGLSRKLYCYSQYTRSTNERLPWRWLALESLKNLEFSSESDIWSFGILMWEIFQLGEQPYPGVASLTNTFIINLENGLRPTIPPFATSDCFNIMSSCWDEEKGKRPSFIKLSSSLTETLDVCKPSKNGVCRNGATGTSQKDLEFQVFNV